MAIMKFNGFSVDAEIAGEMRQVDWDGRRLEIGGITTMGQAAEIISRLSANGVIGFASAELDRMIDATNGARERVGAAVKEFEATRAEIPAAPPTTHPLAVPPGVEPVKITVEAAKAEPPKEQSAVPAQQASQSAAASASATPASPSEDLAVFGRFTKLSEVVAEVRRRGHDDYAAVLAFCKRLADLGDVCPPIDVLSQAGKLEERLKVHCAGRGVPGVPA